MSCRVKCTEIKAEARIIQRIYPSIFQGDAVGQGSHGTADPPADNKCAGDIELLAEYSVDHEDAPVHEEDAKLRRASDGEVKHRRYIREFGVQHVFWCIHIAWVCIDRCYGSCRIDGVAFIRRK